MIELDAFILAAALLLLTPGPTNTLLAAGGALMGARRALEDLKGNVARAVARLPTHQQFVDDYAGARSELARA